MRTIPQRELRNHIGQVLREVEAGERMRVTVDGRPVADLVPIERRRKFVSRDEIGHIIGRAPLDPGFPSDLEDVIGTTIDDL